MIITTLRLSLLGDMNYNMDMGRIGQIPWNKGKTKVYSEETLNRMRLSAQSDVSTDEIIKLYKQNNSCNKIAKLLDTNYSVVRRRLIPTGLLRDKGCATRGKKLSLETRKKMSETWKMLLNDPEYLKKHRIGKNNPFYGKHHKPETIEAMKKKLSILLSGKNHWNWKGGITPETIQIRQSAESKAWRKSVFMRDYYTCTLCGLKGGWNKQLKKKIVLNADHIKRFSDYPKLRFTVSNGRTLCEDCHKKTDTWGNKIRENKPW